MTANRSTLLHRFLGHLPAAAGYVLMAILATFPTIGSLTTRVLGHPEGDVWKHMWGLWWIRDSWERLHVFPVHTTLMNYPLPADFFFADPVNAILSIPLQSIWSLGTTYNLLLLFSLWLGGMGAYLLANHFVRSRAAAFIAGAIYGFSAYLLAYSVGSGVTETVQVGWIPLYILFFIRTWEESRWHNPVLAGLFFFLTTFACWYYGMFTLVFSVLLFAYCLFRFIQDKRPSLDAITRSLLRMLVAAAVFAVMILPPLIAFKAVLKAPNNVIFPEAYKDRGREARTMPVYLTRSLRNYARLSDYFIPGKDNIEYTEVLDRLCRVSYLGYAALALAGFGIWRGWRKRRFLAFWAGSALFFFIMALGPFIYLGPHVYLKRPPSYLYVLMYSYFPAFNQVAIPFRMVNFLMLCLGILAAYGFAELAAMTWGRSSSAPVEEIPDPDSARFRLPLPAWPARVRAGGALLVALLILAEVVLFSPAPFPIPTSPLAIPSFYHLLAEKEGKFAIIDLPATRGKSELIHGEYFYYQTLHGKPIPYRTSGVFSEPMLRNLLLAYLRDTEGRYDLWRYDRDEIQDSLEWLQREHFRYIVVHFRDLAPGLLPRFYKGLATLLGKPILTDDGLMIFDLGRRGLPDKGTRQPSPGHRERSGRS